LGQIYVIRVTAGHFSPDQLYSVLWQKCMSEVGVLGIVAILKIAPGKVVTALAIKFRPVTNKPGKSLYTGAAITKSW
jgi:hypothetical protein